MFKKLTEQSSRDHTRTIYINMKQVDKVYTIQTGTRIWIGSTMTDVIESIEEVLGYNEEVIDGRR